MKWNPKAKTNGSRLIVAVFAAVLVVPVLTGTRFSSVNRAQGQDHSQHCAPAQKPIPPSTPISPLPQQSPKPSEQKAVAPKTSDPAGATLKMIYSQQLPSLQNAILRAIGQIESGNSQAALAELKRVQSSLDALQKAIERRVKPPFVNAPCPIMGTPVQATNVPLPLTRSFEGQRVAFCCGNCPGAWDRLPYPEKAAKLTAAIGRPEQEPAGPTR
jgi:hypothetical protein